MSGFDFGKVLGMYQQGREMGLADLQRQSQIRAGQIGASGDYEGAAKSLLGAGDFQTAVPLLSVARLDAKQRQELAGQRQLSELLGGGGGASVAPQAPLGGATGGDYFSRTRAAESAGNDAARNPNSTATGRYQFIEGTWKGLMKSNPELGLTPDGRTDPAQQERAMQAFTQQNARALQQRGIQPTDGNLYMAHFLGAGAAPQFIQTATQNPNVPATSLVTPQVVAANRSVFLNEQGQPRTAGEVYQRMTARFGGGMTAAGGPPQMAGGVQVANNEADVRRLESQMPQPRPTQTAGIAGDNAAQLEADAAYYERSNPEAARQMRERAAAARTGQPVQMAQAPATGMSDVPAPGSAPAQFVMPGQPAQPQSQRSALPPGDPRPTLSTQQLYQALGIPGISDGQKLAINRIIERREQWANRDPMADELKREQLEGQRLQNAERRRQADEAGAPAVQRIKQPDGSEVAVQWDRRQNAWVPLQAPQGGNAVASPKLTEQQSKDVGFYNRARAIVGRMDKQDESMTGFSGTIGRAADMVPGGNFVKPDAYRQAQQTGRELLAVILRKDTGAAVTDGEMQMYGDIYLPGPGDDKVTIQQKRDARRTAIEGLRLGLGPAEILFRSQSARSGGAQAPQPQTPVQQPPQVAPQGRTSSGLNWSLEQ
jgi:hypothetical protein